ncbi:MAG: zinc ABC transporter substrate-binding protein [Candidatus Omnitrophica bacterium]|nr:zinc ABC transporter substrate-binding protein [Candidatus Omnitrophota bacterium]MCB9719466.1 zinc ABC transporter substrate-binding protein [Candidatus Omnitrophota bacterium]
MKRAFLILSLAGALLGQMPGTALAKKIQVVATIGMISDIAGEVGGDRVEVRGLMGPGVDPHLYKATESDVNKLAKADIILYNGLNLEAKMERVFQQMRRGKKTVAVCENIAGSKLLDSINYPGHFDPHVWFDVTLWTAAVDEVTRTLMEFDPDGGEYYRQRADVYRERLVELHRYVTGRAGEVPPEQRVLITAHDAFRYFGRQYGFEVKGLQGMSTEAEAGTRDVIELANFIVARRIKAIFVESSVPERNIRAVQDAVRAQGWNVVVGGELFSDAMGNAGTVEGTYIGMVTHNIDTIVDALK